MYDSTRSAVRGGVEGSVEKRADGGRRLGVKYRVPPAPTPPTVKCCDSLSSSAAVISSWPTSPRFARVISLLSRALLILPGDDLPIGGCDSGAVDGRTRVICFCGDARPSCVDAGVAGKAGGGASGVRFRVSALGSMAGHKSSRYSGDEEAFRDSGSRAHESRGGP